MDRVCAGKEGGEAVPPISQAAGSEPPRRRVASPSHTPGPGRRSVRPLRRPAPALRGVRPPRLPQAFPRTCWAVLLAGWTLSGCREQLHQWLGNPSERAPTCAPGRPVRWGVGGALPGRPGSRASAQTRRLLSHVLPFSSADLAPPFSPSRLTFSHLSFFPQHPPVCLSRIWRPVTNSVLQRDCEQRHVQGSVLLSLNPQVQTIFFNIYSAQITVPGTTGLITKHKVESRLTSRSKQPHRGNGRRAKRQVIVQGSVEAPWEERAPRVKGLGGRTSRFWLRRSGTASRDKREWIWSLWKLGKWKGDKKFIRWKGQIHSCGSPPLTWLRAGRGWVWGR